VWNAECGMRRVEWGMRSSECGVRNAECGVWNAECGMRNAEYAHHLAMLLEFVAGTNEEELLNEIV